MRRHFGIPRPPAPRAAPRPSYGPAIAVLVVVALLSLGGLVALPWVLP